MLKVESCLNISKLSLSCYCCIVDAVLMQTIIRISKLLVNYSDTIDAMSIEHPLSTIELSLTRLYNIGWLLYLSCVLIVCIIWSHRC